MGKNPMQSAGCYAICAAILRNPNCLLKVVDFSVSNHCHGKTNQKNSPELFSVLLHYIESHSQLGLHSKAL